MNNIAHNNTLMSKQILAIQNEIKDIDEHLDYLKEKKESLLDEIYVIQDELEIRATQ